MNRGSLYFPKTLSIFCMILSAHWTEAAIIASVRGLPCGPPNKSSAVFKCRATRMPATIANTRLRPSSIRTFYDFRLLFVYSGPDRNLSTSVRPRIIGHIPHQIFAGSASLYVSPRGGGNHGYEPTCGQGEQCCRASAAHYARAATYRMANRRRSCASLEGEYPHNSAVGTSGQGEGLRAVWHQAARLEIPTL